jgi:sugar O-acyltransferase (sialic acid O-acetyltransferase NeuD family)
MKDLAIYGAGGFGREVEFLIQQINSVNKKWNIIGFFDDAIKKGTEVNGYSVIGNIDNLKRYNKKLDLVIAIGNPKVKRKVLNKITNENVTYPNIIYPGVSLNKNKYITIGEGCIITEGVLMTVNITLGSFVVINLDCTIGHDTIIKDYSALMPSVNISGEVVIEEGVYCGTGATVINRVNIGQYTTVGAGAVVAKSLPPNCTAVGIPAKPIKYHNEI